MNGSSNLFLLRKQRGITIKELSEMSGVNYWTISSYEQKKRNINKAKYENVKKLAQALEVEPKSLLEIP